MRIELPITFSGRTVTKGRERPVQGKFYDIINVEIPEVSSEDAPVSVSWTAKNTRNEARWFKDRNHVLSHSSAAVRNLPLEQQVQVLFQKRFGDADISGAFPIGERRKTADIVDSREMDRALWDAGELASKLLIVDGELHSAVPALCYRVNRNDLFNSSANFSFRPCEGLTGHLKLRYYQVDQFRQMVEENFAARHQEITDPYQVEALIPEALVVEGPAFDLLNASAFVMHESFSSTMNVLISTGPDHPSRDRWERWNELRSAFLTARDTMNEDDLGNLCTALQGFIRHTWYDFTDSKKAPKLIRDNIRRYRDRPLALEMDPEAPAPRM